MHPVGFFQVLEAAAGGASGAVNQDVQPPKMRCRRINETLGIDLRAQVGHDGKYLPSCFLGDILRSPVKGFLTPGADRHVDTFPSQGQGRCLADTHASTTYQGNSAIQT